MVLRGLKKGQKKEIYCWNKTKIFSSFMLYSGAPAREARQRSTMGKEFW